MKEIMVAATSLDGKITRGNTTDTYSWTSPEDKQFFASQVTASNLIVMGRKTYEAAREHMAVSLERLRVIMTKTPENFAHEVIPHALEFTAETPEQIVRRLEEQGYEKMLILGGASVYTAFMRAGLVDEIYLTVEPIVFGSGKNLFADQDFEADLSLIEQKKLNDRGTLLLKYKVK